MWINVHTSWVKIIYLIKSFKMKYYWERDFTGSQRASNREWHFNKALKE